MTSAPVPVSAAVHTMTETRGATAISVAAEARPALESVPLPLPMPAPVRLPEAMPIAMPSRLEERIEREVDVALPPAVFETTATADFPNPDVPEPQQAVVGALAVARLTSAADAMADAAWTIAEGEARIQTGLSKTMLPVVMNAEAEKIVRATLAASGVGALKLVFLPAADAGEKTPAKKTRPARNGSVEARAKEHPVVQQAQRLFNAEIRNVIDLSETE